MVNILFMILGSLSILCLGYFFMWCRRYLIKRRLIEYNWTIVQQMSKEGTLVVNEGDTIDLTDSALKDKLEEAYMKLETKVINYTYYPHQTTETLQ